MDDEKRIVTFDDADHRLGKPKLKPFFGQNDAFDKLDHFQWFQLVESNIWLCKRKAL